jgi:hypothetical protein
MLNSKLLTQSIDSRLKRALVKAKVQAKFLTLVALVAVNLNGSRQS